MTRRTRACDHVHEAATGTHCECVRRCAIGRNSGDCSLHGLSHRSSSRLSLAVTGVPITVGSSIRMHQRLQVLTGISLSHLALSLILTTTILMLCANFPPHTLAKIYLSS
ncbi:hypothetical protein TNCV_2874931 [Trichonephila clavipes]|nr:hypothetical protein TNCV_2874931 [Trichonephila clavipes]